VENGFKALSFVSSRYGDPYERLGDLVCISRSRLPDNPGELA